MLVHKKSYFCQQQGTKELVTRTINGDGLLLLLQLVHEWSSTEFNQGRSHDKIVVCHKEREEERKKMFMNSFDNLLLLLLLRGDNKMVLTEARESLIKLARIIPKKIRLQ